jgi:hypothetical protein
MGKEINLWGFGYPGFHVGATTKINYFKLLRALGSTLSRWSFLLFEEESFIDYHNS